MFRIFTISLSACCLLMATNVNAQSPPHGVKCPDTVNINSYISVYGFTYDEIDTTKVRLYKKNSKFKDPFDSFYVYTTNNVVNEAENDQRHINIGRTHPITNAEDWEVIIAGKYTYKISNVRVGMQLLRHSFWKCMLQSYKVNGIQHKGNEISLSRPIPKHKEIPHN